MVHSPATDRPPKTAVRDPVVGMSVSADAEYRTEHAVRQYDFCTKGFIWMSRCRDISSATGTASVPWMLDATPYMRERSAGRAFQTPL